MKYVQFGRGYSIIFSSFYTFLGVIMHMFRIIMYFCAMKTSETIILIICLMTFAVGAKSCDKHSGCNRSHADLLHRFDETTDRGTRLRIIKKMDDACRSNPADRQTTLRLMIAKAQFYKYDTQTVNRQFAGIDSAKNEYEYMRVKTLRMMNMPDCNFTKYRMASELREYFHSCRDTVMEANMCNSLAGIFDELGEKQQAFRLFRESGRLYKEYGFESAYVRNMLNIANQYFFSGNAKAACATIRKIACDKTIQTDTLFLVNLYMSLYSYTSIREEKELACRKALQLAKTTGRQRLLLMCQSNMGDFFLEQNKTDSAYFYLKECFARRNELGGYMPMYEMDRTATTLFERLGHTDSAFVYLKHGVMMRDSIDKDAVAAKIRQSETIAEIGKYNVRLAQIERDKKRNEILFVAFVIVLLIASGLVFTILYRKWMEKHHEAMAKAKENNTLSTEIKNRERELTTSAMMIEESHTVLNSVKQVLDKRRRGEEISQREVYELANVISCHTDSSNDWEAFKSHFNKVHPELLDRLKSLYPSLTDAELKLCAFLFLGIETKHIAKILSVLPDSVKKARQRLRKKLRIEDPNVRIQDFIREINNGVSTN